MKKINVSYLYSSVEEAVTSQVRDPAHQVEGTVPDGHDGVLREDDGLATIPRHRELSKDDPLKKEDWN